MKTLDFGEIINNDECWFENYNLSCPYCNGLGERTVYIRGGIRSYKKFDNYLEEEEEYCEHCNDAGEFDIAWNTAFHVFLLYSNFDELYKLAWDGGFCLIEHNNDYFLLMGVCGLDCTWMIHNMRLKIQGFLNQEDIKTCISNAGGSVFVSKKERKKMCKYFKENLTTPEEYTKLYRSEIATIDEIVKKGGA